jgi:cell division protein FtsZ
MSPLLDQSIEGARAVLFCVTHNGDLGLRELDSAARVIAELADPNVNTIFGTVIDPAVGAEVHITVIATGFPSKFEATPDPRDARRFADIGLPGVMSMDDAELPAFLRRNIRSLNALPREVGAVAKLAERR